MLRFQYQKKQYRDSNLYIQTKGFFEVCDSKSENVDGIIISQYQRKYDVYRRKLGKANKEAEKEIRSLKILNTQKILSHLSEYRRSKKEQDNFENRTALVHKSNGRRNESIGNDSYATLQLWGIPRCVIWLRAAQRANAVCCQYYFTYRKFDKLVPALQFEQIFVISIYLLNNCFVKWNYF